MLISKTNDKYKLLKDYIKKTPKDYTITDDLQVLKIALDFNLEISYLYYSYEAIFKDDTLNLLNELKNKSHEVYELSNQNIKSLLSKENHAEVIAVIKLNEYKLEDFKNKDFIMVLDSLEIPGNVGTILRTLDSIKCDLVLLVNPVTKINNSKITSSSRGCNLIIPTIDISYDDAQKFLLDNNYDIYLGEPKLGLNYKEYDYNTKTALVVGNERFGINNNWYNNNHKKVYIPMEGNQNSLNVSVAASILAYEVYMKKNNL